MRFVIRILTPVLFLLAMLLPAGGAAAAPGQTGHGEAVVFAFNTCAGDSVVANGFANSVFVVHRDGSVFVHYTINATAVSGNEYVLNAQEIIKVSDSGGYSQDDRFLMVSKGSAPNEWLLIHFDSVTGVTVTSECRG